MSRGLLWACFHPVWLPDVPAIQKLEELSSLTEWRVLPNAFSCKPMAFLSCFSYALSVAHSQAVSWGIWKLPTCSLDPDPELHASLGPEHDFLHFLGTGGRPVGLVGLQPPVVC